MVYEKMYQLIFDKKALDFLNKLEKGIKERIFSNILKKLMVVS